MCLKNKKLFIQILVKKKIKFAKKYKDKMIQIVRMY